MHSYGTIIQHYSKTWNTGFKHQFNMFMQSCSLNFSHEEKSFIIQELVE